MYLWLDTALLVREFDSSLTVISYADPQSPAVTKILRGEFARRDNIFQIGTLLLSCELDSEKRLKFIRAEFDQDTVKIIDTVSYGEEQFESCSINDIAEVNDSTVAISFHGKENYDFERILYIKRNNEELLFSKHCAIDPLDGGLSIRNYPQMDFITATAWVGFSNYRTNYIICNDSNNISRPITVSDNLLANWKGAVSGISTNDTIFKNSTDFRVDTSTNYAYVVKNEYNGNEHTTRLETYSFSFSPVAINEGNQHKAGKNHTGYTLQRSNNMLMLNGLEESNYKVQVYSVNGRLLLSSELSKSMNRLELSSLANGTYLLNIKNLKMQQSSIVKFIK